MSADEFDPAIERLFARAPRMADDALFVAEFRTRLEKRSRWRGVALTGAGLIGGLIAVREGINLNFTGGEAEVTTLGQGAQAVAVTAQGAVQSGLGGLGLDSLGLGSIDLMSGSGMAAFWIVAGALVALLAAGAVRLSQDI
ncbi:MAG: hypothetical protein DI552_08410 [Brevundimonas sp.]|jgi:hypothetical protein|uniref:Uncharacterized protein n=1 Tax=Brevundimonas albigilva TaxID=1312364 RepID=A0ABY4SGY6_9CAUL|nr:MULTISPECIES: hypothetical protein [Brevundimonas]PZU57250.1 MAG: hypothetical protein DI552_08410 [Brevundimonas sp.]UQV17985.1 hypothetical protein MU852_14565 [Brevundimonas albigilva]URI14033.1 hypothetical protein M8231_09335 [Brevundimonas albigilva]